jgi:ATP-dependent DNA ligase I
MTNIDNVCSLLPRHKFIREEPTGDVGGSPVVVMVDAFSESNKLPERFFQNNRVFHFLTHAHADHYTGLSTGAWSRPGRQIFCNRITGSVVRHILDLPEENIEELKMDEKVQMHPLVTVTAIDANHCPGACMLIFEFACSGRRVLHTGDFRYTASWQIDSQYLRALVHNGCDELYLDTTYCHPRHKTIPDQKVALDLVEQEVAERLKGDAKKLCLVSTYCIGKERVLDKISNVTGSKIFVDDRKYEILSLLGMDMAVFTTNPIGAATHVVKWNTLGETWPYFRPNYTAPAQLAREHGFKSVIGFVPTGWVSASQQRSFRKNMDGIDVEIVLVPYSEHSSWSELLEFVGWIRPKRVVPTVGATNERAIQKMLGYFRNLVDESASKKSFLDKMRKRCRKDDGNPSEVIEQNDVKEEVVDLIHDEDDGIVILSESSGKASESSFQSPMKPRNSQGSILQFLSISPPPPSKKEKKETILQDRPFPSPYPPQSSSEAAGSPLNPGRFVLDLKDGQIAVDREITLYHPVDDAGWNGSVTPYLCLAKTMDTMESSTKRLFKERCLINVFRSILAVSPSDLVPAVYLMLGRLAEEHEGIELNIGGHTLARCVAESLGVSLDRIKAKYRELGDMGSVAAATKSTQRVLVLPRPQSVRAAYNAMMSVATTKGKQSQSLKKKKIVRLLRGCVDASETKFLVRALVSNLRIGANWRSVIPAIGKAYEMHRLKDRFPSDEELVDAGQRMLDAYCRCPSIDRCVAALLSGDVGDISIEIGMPTKPMLAKPAGKGVSAALATISKVFVGPPLLEFKYDGMRGLIHVCRKTSTVKVFSRNGEDRTSTFAEVPDLIERSLCRNVSNVVLDAEICAVSDDGKIESFQKLSARQTNGCRLCVFLFDCIHMNGTSLLHLSLSSRREQLHSIITDIPNAVEFAKAEELADISSDGVLKASLSSALENKAEGLMIKDLSSTYDCNQRSSKWLKLKRDYCEDDTELSDTMDVRPIGAWWGNGRKAGWYSPFLLAIYNEESESWESLCRCLSGFSDDFYKQATERLKQHTVENKPLEYSTAETPPVWFDSNEIWEIRGADLQLSPVHAAGKGMVDEARGLGLRFPRFVSIRSDKNLEDATTSDEIVSLYRIHNT